jgi:hypothetical protein
MANDDAGLAAWGERSAVRRWGLVVWPAFLAASVLQTLVFALVDPGELHWPVQIGQPSRQAVYAVAFFVFWTLNMACSAVVLWLAQAGLNVPVDARREAPIDRFGD